MVKDLLRSVADQKNDPNLHGAPFWAWNGKLEKDELIRQIHVMKDMGLGGFFMHSRVGLNTPYLSEEWFDYIRCCIDEAEKLNMNAWIYDEDRWPSGAAGGIVTKDLRYRIRSLVMLWEGEETDGLQQCELGRFAVMFAPGTERFCSYRKLSQNEIARDDEKAVRFVRAVSNSSSWFNGEAYLDTMSVEAVDKFIEETHEVYRREISEKFGKSVPGIFTDEPNFAHCHASGNRVQWTDSLPEKFKNKYGYDILEHLPELFIYSDRENFSKVRYHFYNLCSDLFTHAFSERIGKWCEDNNMLYTGHLLQEGSIEYQTRHVGDCMRFYEYMQAPGMDLLTEYRDEFMTAKQVTSVAHQFGKKIRLSETYGCTGWDFPFYGHKALGDWQIALGINLRCQHLAWYTSAAEAKRDYPASISYQSPWADRHKQLEDYFGRVGAVINSGEESRDLLLLHPVESYWGIAVYDKFALTANENENAADWNINDPQCSSKSFNPIHNRLLMEHLDFDLGCEEIMSRHGRIEKDKLYVNLAAYKAVLLPPLRTIRSSTLELLEKFADAGGTVVYIGEAPERVDAEKTDKAAAVFEKFIQADIEKAVEVIGKKIRRVSVSSEGKEICSILSSIHTGSDYQSLFVCNFGKSLHWTPYTDRNPPPNAVLNEEEMQMIRKNRRTYPNAEIKWLVPEGYGIYELDTASGKWYKVPFSSAEGYVVINSSFEPLQSRIFVASREEITSVYAQENRRVKRNSSPLFAPGQGMKYKLSEKNILVLDKPEYKINGGNWNPAEQVLALDDRLRTFIGSECRGGAMIQPWCNVSRKKTGEVNLSLRYTFNVDVIPQDGAEFAIERPDLYQIYFNGNLLDNHDTGWWCDLAIRKVFLPKDMFVIGGNVIELECLYDNLLPGLEMSYVIGDFGIKNNTLISLPDELTVGDWCKQGLPNFAGNLDYIIPLDKVSGTIELGEWRGVAVEYSINGSDFKLLAWPPFVISLGEEPVSGTLTLRILGHRRNAMGPFYLAKRPFWTGPAQFKLFETEERQLVKCGLIDVPTLYR